MRQRGLINMQTKEWFIGCHFGIRCILPWKFLSNGNAGKCMLKEFWTWKPWYQKVKKNCQNFSYEKKCVTTVANNQHWYGSPTVSNRSLVNITLLMKSLGKTTAKIKFYNSHLAHIVHYQKLSQSLPFEDTIILTMYGISVKVNWLLTALPQGSAIFNHCSWSHAKALLSQSFACTSFMADK